MARAKRKVAEHFIGLILGGRAELEPPLRGGGRGRSRASFPDSVAPRRDFTRRYGPVQGYCAGNTAICDGPRSTPTPSAGTPRRGPSARPEEEGPGGSIQAGDDAPNDSGGLLASSAV